LPTPQSFATIALSFLVFSLFFARKEKGMADLARLQQEKPLAKRIMWRLANIFLRRLLFLVVLWLVCPIMVMPDIMAQSKSVYVYVAYSSEIEPEIKKEFASFVSDTLSSLSFQVNTEAKITEMLRDYRFKRLETKLIGNLRQKLQSKNVGHLLLGKLMPV
jgi:hypothetical protein